MNFDYNEANKFIEERIMSPQIAIQKVYKHSCDLDFISSRVFLGHVHKLMPQSI